MFALHECSGNMDVQELDYYQNINASCPCFKCRIHKEAQFTLEDYSEGTV